MLGLVLDIPGTNKMQLELVVFKLLKIDYSPVNLCVEWTKSAWLN